MASRIKALQHVGLSLICITTALAFTAGIASPANASSAAPAAETHGKAAAPAAPKAGPAPAPAPSHGAAPASAAPVAPKPTASALPPVTAAKAAQTPETKPAPAESAGPMNADQILAMMKEGNNHFRAGKFEMPNATSLRRFKTASEGQKPVATIISCSDSRVPVELIFDRGIGDLFVIRVAGEVCDTDEIGSAEYGVEHLGTPVLVVMGHTKCGAVTAVVTGAPVHGSIAPLVAHIKPAVATAKKEHPQHVGDDLLNDAIKANVFQSIEDMLTKSEIIRECIKAGKVRVEGAIYDIESGTIEWIGPHPKQKVLVESEAAAAEGHASNSPAKHEAGAESAEPSHDNAPAAPARAGAKSEAAPSASAGSTVSVASAQTGMTAALAAAVPVEQPRRSVASKMEALPSLLERCMAEELYQQGMREVEAGDYALAAEKLRSAGQLDPSMLAARSDLAGVLYLQQKYAEALELYKSVLTSDGHYANAIRGAALCHASLKEYDSARTMLRKLVDLNRRDAQVWLDLGDVSFLAGDAPAARENWETASRLTSASPEVVKQANLRLNVYGGAPAITPVAQRN